MLHAYRNMVRMALDALRFVVLLISSVRVSICSSQRSEQANFAVIGGSFLGPSFIFDDQQLLRIDIDRMWIYGLNIDGMSIMPTFAL